LALEASHWHNGTILVLQPKGRFEAPNTGAFEAPIRERILSGDRNIIIDMAEVEAIDTAGVHSLLAIAAQMVVHHGKLVVCGLENNILSLFKITAFDQVVEIADDYEDALESFR